MVRKIYRIIIKNENSIINIRASFIKIKFRKKQSLKLYENIIKKCDKDIIKTIDNYDFLDYVLESDVLICEPTSLVAEYSITNNPILLQGNYEELNGIWKKIIKKKNIVNDFDDIYNILKKCKHKNIKVYSNIYFYKNKYKLNFSDYLIKLLMN